MTDIIQKIGDAIENQTQNGEAGIVPVSQNLFGIADVQRTRPYMSSPAEQINFMRLLSYERSVLNARIKELNSRADQILYIYACRISKAYLAAADPRRRAMDDTYFYEWLDELATQGIAYATRRTSKNGGFPIYRWDDIQKVLDVCLSKGLDLETSAKVASVGVEAVEKYLRNGIISLDEQAEARHVGRDTVVPEASEEISADEMENERQADVLKELAEATSTRGATIMARERIGSDYVRISAINKGESDIAGFVRYDVEVQLVKKRSDEYTPYQSRTYFEEETPIQAIKFYLRKLSESLSRSL